MAHDHTASVRIGRASLSSELDMALGEEPEPTGAATAFLVGLGGRHAGKLFRLRSGESIIGRTSKAFLSLDEKAVSHRHARLTLDQRGCTIEDLGSTNGTFVNDVRLEAPQLLNAGDVIKVGMAVFGYLTDAEDEQQHTRAMARMTSPQLSSHTLPSPSSPPDALVQVHPDGMPGGPAELVRHTGNAASLTPSIPAEPGAMGQLDKMLDFLELALSFGKRYWKLLLLCSVLMGLLGIYSIFIRPPAAIASAELYLRQEGMEGTARHFATRDVEFFAFADKTFSNEELVRQSLKKVNPTPGPGLVTQTSKGLALGRAGPKTYEASFTHGDSRFAEDFLAIHLRTFLEHEINDALSVLNSEVELLRGRYEQNQEQLRELEQELRQYKQKNLDSLPETAAQQVGSRAELLVRKDQLSANLDRYTRELELARKRLRSEDALLARRVVQSAPYEDALTEVNRQLAQASAKGYKSEHPEVARLKREKERLKDLRERTVNATTTETDRRANPEYKALENEVGSLEVAVKSTQTELGLVQTRLEEIRKIAGELPAVEAGIADKMRKVAAAEQLHRKLFEQLKGKELELQFERASVAALYEIISPPHAWPVDPKTAGAKRGVAGLVAGFVLGVILALTHWVVAYSRRRKMLDGAAHPTMS